MRSGLLRHLVVLQVLGSTQDALGQPVIAWTDFATVWGDVRFLNGLETVKADMPIGVVRASIRMRYLAGVVPNMRATYDGKVFDIKAVLPDPTGRHFIDLACESGANNG